MSGNCIVVPIILEKVDWTDEIFAQFNALPRKGKPVRSYKPQSDAWYEVGVELRRLLEKICASSVKGFRDGARD